LVRAHLAAGNRAAARDQFQRFRLLLAAELQVEPSTAMTTLIEKSDPAPGNSVSSNSRGDTTVTVGH